MQQRTNPYVKKHIQVREERRNRTIHLEHLRNVKASEDTGLCPVVLNNRKKDWALESKFTEIERENRILLEKITGIFSKRGNRTAYSSEQKSLNIATRRKRLQDIEESNARLLKRLQERKSDYDVDRMRRDWRRQLELTKNISSHPEKYVKPFTASTSTHAHPGHPPQLSPFDPHRTYELSKVKVVDWYTFHVAVRLDRNGLAITANNSASRDLKIIEIERGEALDFIREECHNKLENIFDRLRYDGANMLLVGEDVDVGPRGEPADKREASQDGGSRTGARSTTPKLEANEEG